MVCKVSKFQNEIIICFKTALIKLHTLLEHFIDILLIIAYYFTYYVYIVNDNNQRNYTFMSVKYAVSGSEKINMLFNNN